MILEFLEQIFSFFSADSDIDATVTCSGVVWSCLLVSRGTDGYLLSIFVIFMIAFSPKFGGTNTFSLGGTWYLMSWYLYQRLPLSLPSCLRLLSRRRFYYKKLVYKKLVLKFQETLVLCLISTKKLFKV